MKGFVIALTAIVVAAVLIVFYGGTRPAGDADSAIDRVESGFGWLVPDRVLGFDDLDAPCADEASRQLEVGGLQVCRFAVPEPSNLLLCADPETPISVTTDGEEYPEQRVDAADVVCGSEQQIPVYDAGTIVSIGCLAPAAVLCRVQVLQPEG